MNEKYYVITGNYREYLDFANQKCSELWSQGHEISMSNFIHVTIEDQLRGVQNPHGWLYGTWMDNPSIKELLMAMSVTYHDEPVPPSLVEAWKILNS